MPSTIRTEITHSVETSSSSASSNIIPSDDNNEEPILITEEDDEVDDDTYLNKPPTIPSFTTSKRVPRLGPFLLLKTLGVGEFGKVKMARHIETGQTVAVKLVKKENIDSSSQLEKIRMEIDILKTLNHPYIVKLLSVNETNTCIGMVLEYAQGGELFEYIYRQRYLKEEEACRLFSQLISCVYYMHQKNIVHRDLKLENILLDRRGNLIVTDFGFANQFTSKAGDLMSTSCGSPVYAAPELVMTGRLYAGAGVDIWSCGIILYAMLCGYLPFDDDAKNPNGGNIGRLYRYIMANKPKYPPHLSHDSKDVIGKMLIPDPNQRCKIETIMSHPWLYKYQAQILKSTQEWEAEARILKENLLKGVVEDEDINDVEDVCCDNEDEVSLCSSSSGNSSNYSFPPPTVTISTNEAVTQPSTPIPYQKDIVSKTIEELTTTERLVKKPSHASHQQSIKSSKKAPASTLSACSSKHSISHKHLQPQQVEKTELSTLSASSSSSSSIPITKKKRHTLDSIPTTTKNKNFVQPTTKVQRPTLMPVHHSSLRAKLFSSVKRRNLNSSMVEREDPLPTPTTSTTRNNRHSWQNLMHRHSSGTSTTLPLSPPSSPIMPEHSKSVRLMTWLKSKSSSTITNNKKHNNSSRSNSLSSSAAEIDESPAYKDQHDATLPIAKPYRVHDIERLSIASELRVHAGDMNRSALTSKPPMEVLLEINKILLILGIEVENVGGYKLQCMRRSTHHYNSLDSSSDMMNHLSTSHAPALSQPIYGHPSIDNGQEIEFSVEICRFENLSGLFSVDIQCRNEKNFKGYQFIGQKLLALLHAGNTIRNTNFSVMLNENK